MIHSIIINDFRGLHNVDVKLGKYITAISGKNGLGKSTILALIGNTCELKVKEGKTMFNTQFRTEFGEIFKASKEFDKSGSNKCKVNFSDFNNPNEIRDTKICRVTWQRGRFRIIPETKKIKEKNSRKKEWPSIYLGLSRLYPIGEAKEDGIKINNIKLSKEEEEYFIDNYMNILNLKNEEEICLDMIDIDETKRKKGIGIKTSNYSSITNSAGQDNLGQIILSVLSFKRLLEHNKKYSGGLLLIDELEATLHPVAQIKLLNFLLTACRKFKLQVVFTTHSISLLKELCIKNSYDKSDDVNNCEVCYLTKSNGPLISLKNPKFHIIENDLMINQAGRNINKVTVYSEDNEGRWFFEKLTKEYDMYLRRIKIKLGCSELLNLNKNDPQYFSNVLFVLDGDVQEKDINKFNSLNNIIKLPGKIRPEEVIYNFLINLDPECSLWRHGYNIGFTKESIREHGPFSKRYKGKDRDRFKTWFNDNIQVLDELNVYKYWIEYNKDEYDEFMNSFKNSYNDIASRIFGIII
ncbi:hypothetical protein EXM98_06370 [Clostridium botulinum]|nr:hypothetical protein [Clostridium botulinum]NEZ98808.1 hypothetical protein [Clostridium botulinum]NFA31548.1 hypothetical protein [Clostridium botulinum]NFA86233.1 hypothetical protein [Clostridium botulinum]NFB04829.1 hypothetical protein [Clostridium botulinum]